MPTLVIRAANQAARAIVKVIEDHTGKPVSLYDSMRLVNVIGCALERNGLEGGPSGEIRAILEQEQKGERPDPDRIGDPAMIKDLTAPTVADATGLRPGPCLDLAKQLYNEGQTDLPPGLKS